MRDAEVLILDEPTAALDAEAEHELFERFQAAGRGPHRDPHLATASPPCAWPTASPCCTTGRVEELGTHDELLARNGRYAHLFRLQASGYVS